MIRFACSCGRQLQARDEDVGKKAKCPSCARIMTVPRPSKAGLTTQENRDAFVQQKASRGPQTAEDTDPLPDESQSLSPTEEVSGKAIAALALALFSLLLPILATIPALILGRLALRDIRKSHGQVAGKGLALSAILLSCLTFFLQAGGTFLLLMWVFRGPQQAPPRDDNLTQLASAMDQCSQEYGLLPQATAYQTRFGQPALSWRVALLRYLGEEQLFQQFKLDEPWDHPHNHALLRQMPKVYQLPEQENADGLTYYQVFVGPGALFEPPPPRPKKLAEIDRPLQLGLNVPGDIPDGASNTILIATARNPVPWTKPADLVFKPRELLPPLGGHHPGGFFVALADGSVRFLRQTIDEETLKAAITRNGGEIRPLP